MPSPFRDDVIPNDFVLNLAIRPDADSFYISYEFLHRNNETVDDMTGIGRAESRTIRLLRQQIGVAAMEVSRSVQCRSVTTLGLSMARFHKYHGSESGESFVASLAQNQSRCNEKER